MKLMLNLNVQAPAAELEAQLRNTTEMLWSKQTQCEVSGNGYFHEVSRGCLHHAD